MRFIQPLAQNISVTVIAEADLRVRLARLCFRGPERKLAGNCCRWRSLEECLSDNRLLQGFREHALRRILASKRGISSFSVDFGEPIGWESTDRWHSYRSSVLEPFNPNRRSRALRVRMDRKDLFAPRTSLLTLVYDLRSEEGIDIAVIKTLYPGVDIGELAGDITRREGRVFFDWDHPGA